MGSYTMPSTPMAFADESDDSDSVDDADDDDGDANSSGTNEMST